MHKEENYKKLFSEFNHLNILIIGDVMIDSYLWGKVDRISPEAPIPIVALKNRENRMGGAANVARNIKAMGANPILCAVIGNDGMGDVFCKLLEEEKITTRGLVRSNNRITTTKFRIFGNNTQMLRVDEEVESDLSEHDHLGLMTSIEKILNEEKVDCIILQDYNKGVLMPAVITTVVQMARLKKIPVTVDPKKKNFDYYKHVTLFKPNLKELKEGLKTDFESSNREMLMTACHQLLEHLQTRFILTTLSENGIMIGYQEGIDQRNIFIPAHLRTISDVSGAGDTVISVASLCLAMGCSPYEIAYISNLAGGLVCEEVGVVPVNKEKLLKEVVTLL
ncbi:MAG: bifunctional heptose 7-phosphate kinase/heptose 1-phosphate adenyltransferase [Syntrophothermus sp.]